MSLPIESAIDLAKQNMTEIFTVKEWAEEMKFNSSKYFSRKFRNAFGDRPKTKLIEIRINRFHHLINENLEISCYEIALELGLRDQVALNRFINRHTGKPPTEWKKG